MKALDRELIKEIIGRIRKVSNELGRPQNLDETEEKLLDDATEGLTLAIRKLTAATERPLTPNH